MAQRLRDAGVTGVLGHPRSCPIANYLRQETGIDVRVDYVKTSNDWLSKIPVRNPEVVEYFIRRFDSRHYPELENFS